jgi:DMSO/TMAO reductase YedYZ molybdopterin-dependent catalytic subunit
MATQHEDLEPDFLRMDGPHGTPTETAGLGSGRNMGWPSRNVAEPKTIVDDNGRITRIRTPVMDLDGLMTPTHLFYVVQHFAVPEPISPEDWRLSIDGAVQGPLEITYEDLRRLPARTVRTVMECSGSDANYFEYFQGVGQKPLRCEEAMILSAGEFTGVPLAAVLERAGLGSKAAHVRVEGWDKGVPASASPGTAPFLYDKGLPLEKALHPGLGDEWGAVGTPARRAGAPGGARLVGQLVGKMAAPHRSARAASRLLVSLQLLLLWQFSERSQQGIDHHHRREINRYLSTR